MSKILLLFFVIGCLYSCKEASSKSQKSVSTNTPVVNEEIPNKKKATAIHYEEIDEDITDLDLVEIGSQVWTSKNLNVSKYRNGDAIPQVQNLEEWLNLTTGAWCYISDDPKYGKKYGKLYNWYAVIDPRGLAPEGFHIPSKQEWMDLFDYVGGRDNAGKNLKSSTSHWILNSQGTNRSGFSGLPGGSRMFGEGGAYEKVGAYGGFWGIVEKEIPWHIGLSNYDQAGSYSVSWEHYGLSIRLIKNSEEYSEELEKEEMLKMVTNDLGSNKFFDSVQEENRKEHKTYLYELNSETTLALSFTWADECHACSTILSVQEFEKKNKSWKKKKEYYKVASIGNYGNPPQEQDISIHPTWGSYLFCIKTSYASQGYGEDNLQIFYPLNGIIKEIGNLTVGSNNSGTLEASPTDWKSTYSFSPSARSSIPILQIRTEGVIDGRAIDSYEEYEVIDDKYVKKTI